ncbi:MAG: UDP-3-O-(3-hydroxymyristoyl)glucosamine N-acyltransferase, partial [Planctomycetes bacterium]|nr:UDP-3-O-(3-hydroxymyristoyl)glucosamine N-acyltransferase [Planctomycetota bacterium]
MIDRMEPEIRTWTVLEITNLVGGLANGSGNVEVTGIAGIREAGEGDITFVAEARYLPLLKHTKAAAVIVSKEIQIGESESEAALIRVDDPVAAFEKIAVNFAGPRVKPEPGIHATAIIGKGARLGKNVAIQAHAVICDGAVVGDDTVIYAGVYIGHE